MLPGQPLVPLLMMLKSFLSFFFFSVQNGLPLVCLAWLAARPKTPASSGDETLVPPSSIQPWLPYVSYSATPNATAETSLPVRLLQLGSCCQEGLVTPEHPPPLSRQPISV